MSKLLYLIRHGYALHNELFLKNGCNPLIFRSSEVFDAPLTQYGHDQSIQLGYNWKNKHKVELVVVSPLMRTLETAMNIFAKGKFDYYILNNKLLKFSRYSK